MQTLVLRFSRGSNWCALTHKNGPVTCTAGYSERKSSKSGLCASIGALGPKYLNGLLCVQLGDVPGLRAWIDQEMLAAQNHALQIATIVDGYAQLLANEGVKFAPEIVIHISDGE